MDTLVGAVGDSCLLRCGLRGQARRMREVPLTGTGPAFPMTCPLDSRPAGSHQTLLLLKVNYLFSSFTTPVPFPK